MTSIQYPHLFIPNAPDSINYRNPAGGGGSFEAPGRSNRTGHADRLLAALDNARQEAENTKDERTAVALPAREGTYLEIESAPEFDLPIGSLEDRGAGINLLNVRREINNEGKSLTKATIYVPHGKHTRLINKIQKYRDEQTKTGAPKNRNLVASIEHIRRALLHSFWYDPVEFIPKNNVQEWCEAWLVTSAENREELSTAFRDLAQKLNLETQDGDIRFVERTVLLLKANANELDSLLSSFEHIAEFRRAKETAAFWTDFPNAQQAEWVENLSARLKFSSNISTSICVLDTGVNHGHPLLTPLITEEQCDSVVSDWGVADSHGHGTAMCGTVTFGENLGLQLQTDTPVEIPFEIESIKLIPAPGKHTGENFYGVRTLQAFSRAQIINAERNRVFCLAITSEDGRDLGRPSSWSGAIDKAISGAEDGIRRLCVVSAGNVQDPNEWKSYPDANFTNSMHDPAQAWNALSVGSVTFMDQIGDADLAAKYRPLARSGQLSPYSSTSRTWDQRWPNKPDIVLEGGNVGIDNENFASQFDSMSLLSLGHKPQEALLGANYATSASAGLAAEMCARLWAAYPDAWPETIRGLMVHSAQWTDQLKEQLHSIGSTPTDNMANLLRVVGYGVPDFQRAMQSAQNSLTLIAQEMMQPFEIGKETKPDNEKPTTFKRARDMHLYTLPWPKEALDSLPAETPITIDITLSYFVEPAPGEKGWRDKYRYRSHGLDFNIKKPTEDEDAFVLRLNKAVRDTDGDYGGASVNWAIGEKKGRTHGSIHRDWVEMTAEEVKSCGLIGVYPRSGWWKERDHLDRGNASTRYSLIVTLRTPDSNIDVDIYTPVASLIGTPVEV